eukprot:CAMPEP_0182437468 /NCGR_PEP_ID=MMETSP1167-20130531/85070_1 /TAXON_ID=2988 /ORGANISM="Mallomonas Sp, Strain CCMP3275" /LENGTH=596 /DNA_ID=CAMNT_0024630403 /DNA_START=1074 /DNA_END=2864 /DNA_ORIENTATION=+
MGVQLLKRAVGGGLGATQVLGMLDDLEGQCDFAVDILNDLLLYERLEEGIIDMNYKPVAMKSFLQSKVHALSVMSEEKGVNLTLSLATELPSSLGPSSSSHDLSRAYVRGDEDKLGQVVRTLIMNAIDSSVQGQRVTVVMDMRRRSPLSSNIASEPVAMPKRRSTSLSSTLSSIQQLPGLSSVSPPVEDKYTVCIQIRDEGVGMTLEDQQKLFKNAFSFTAGVLQVREDKSLGLWIAHRIITLHRGCLSVQSEGVGHGSTYTMELPVSFSSDSGRITFSRASSAASIPVMRVAPAVSHHAFSSPSVSPQSSPREQGNMDLLRTVSGNLMNSMRRLSSDPSIYPRSSPTARRAAPASYSMDAICAPELESSRQRSSPNKTSLAIYTLDHSPIPESEYNDSVHEFLSSRSSPTALEGAAAAGAGAGGAGGTKRRVLVVDDSRMTALEGAAAAGAGAGGAGGTKRRVLVVDDSRMNRLMLCRLLQGYCDETVEAENGSKAVAAIADSDMGQQPFSLVLMDYQMPVLDGPSAAKAMRDLGYNGPIIGVTGNSLPSHINTFMSSGADRVVSKPLNFDTLIRTLTEMGASEILEQRRSISMK